MPCGARLEVVQVAVEREGDVRVSDHVDVEIRVLPVLPAAQTGEIVREELIARGWERQLDGSLTKTFGDALATLPADSSTIRLAVVDQGSVKVSGGATGRIAEGDEAARAAVAVAAAQDGDARLAAAKAEAEKALVQANVERLLRVYDELRGELAEAVNATTKRALEQRAREIGAIESVREGRTSDGGYELAITVRT